MPAKTFEKNQALTIKVGGGIAALFIVAIYFSTSLSNILSVIVGLLWLFSAQYAQLPKVLQQCPVAAWSLALFGCLVVGSSYGSATQGDAFTMISKYRELIFIPVLMPFFVIEHNRALAWKIFIAASIATLLGSFLMRTGLLGETYQLDPTFKSRITHSILMAFFAFFCLHKSYDEQRYKALYIVLFALCIGDVFLVVEGRTGQLIAIALILLFSIQRLDTKRRLLFFIALLLALSLFLNFSDKAHRILEGIANTKAYFKPVPEQTESSMGQRYTFWGNSIKLIEEKPFFGHGTGSFTKEYQRVANGGRIITHNPHNEFLMIALQLGLFGLIFYLGFFSSQYYYAKFLPNTDKWLAHGVLLSLFIASLFNTPYLDHTEGHWFATMMALCFAPSLKSRQAHVSDIRLISVIVTTYNWTSALQLCLNSLYAQQGVPFEIIVADDGSNAANLALNKACCANSPVDIKYAYHEDLGFRAGTIRNKAVALCTGDYLLFIDGDCILPAGFIAKHRRLAKKGYFVSGNRVLLSPTFTQEVIEGNILMHNKTFASFFLLRLQKKINRVSAFLQLPLGFLRLLQPNKWQKAITCNLGVWKADFLAVNGFDELFEGWGFEDSDLVIRLMHAGIKRKEGRFAVTALHLWHPQNDRTKHDENYRRFTERLEQPDFVIAIKGIDQYLK
jgi:O-antigen ligase